MHVIIVGAGIVGLSTAYFLRKSGAEVTVLERGTIPFAAAASADHHRLIRTFYGADRGYTARAPDALAAWGRIFADLPGGAERYFQNTGALVVSREAGDYADQSLQCHQELGVEVERIDAVEIARRFPFLEPEACRFALLGAGGALMANRILVALADWLRASGVLIRELSPVASVDPVCGTVKLAGGAGLGADRIIVTAGVETRTLIPEMRATLAHKRSVIVYADPPEDLRAAWQNAPCWTDLGGDAELWGAAPVFNLPLKLGNGTMGTIDPEDSNRKVSSAEIDTMLCSYCGVFKGAGRFTPRWAQANYWTLAPDHEFLLAARERAVIVSACSGHGFKFAPMSAMDISDLVQSPGGISELAARDEDRGYWRIV